MLRTRNSAKTALQLTIDHIYPSLLTRVPRIRAVQPVLERQLGLDTPCFQRGTTIPPRLKPNSNAPCQMYRRNITMRESRARPVRNLAVAFQSTDTFHSRLWIEASGLLQRSTFPTSKPKILIPRLVLDVHGLDVSMCWKKDYRSQWLGGRSIRQSLHITEILWPNPKGYRFNCLWMQWPMRCLQRRHRKDGHLPLLELPARLLPLRVSPMGSPKPHRIRRLGLHPILQT